MRISDWSSDVCSSDLKARRLRLDPQQQNVDPAIRLAGGAQGPGLPRGGHVAAAPRFQPWAGALLKPGQTAVGDAVVGVLPRGALGDVRLLPRLAAGHATPDP